MPLVRTVTSNSTVFDSLLKAVVYLLIFCWNVGANFKSFFLKCGIESNSINVLFIKALG